MRHIRVVALVTIAAALVFVIALLINATSAEAENAAQKLKIIDAHVHLDFEGKVEQASGIMDSKEEFMKEARAAGVVGFIAHTKSETSPIPDVAPLIPTFCVGVHEEVHLQPIKEGLQSGKYKCIKIYLGYAHKYAYDEIYRPLYALAEKMNVPVVFHTGDTSTKVAKVKYSDPLTIDEVAVDFPHTTFVIAHVGNPWINSAGEVIYKNDNVYGDVSALMIGDLKKYSEFDLKRFIEDPISWLIGYIDNPSKLMFGTDWPLNNIKQYLDVVKRAVPVKYHRAVFHDNAVKVFHIR